ncbi:GNAT family N-acetyltransferase [Rhizorhapis suberifaciens]|uniref:RimJ/RimL family protein N-acetyltransferase n=1 Tax=Rhizorhapis suberifaciens TaxID=13656 RepID=A0A840HXJ1_9SPHN|nr:GNAT family protein [Rhizorhapis suberifaciens]MBB4642371.1 RimJ/RimL family protein N-acetyltransferase [Rhizorhapis suberifaciens]
MIVADDRVARFVSEKLNFGLCPPYTALGIEKDGEIIAGAIFNVFEGVSIHVSVAGKGWTRDFLKAVGTYVFDQLGCERMTATTEQEDVIKLACRLGGQVEGVLRNQFGAGRDGTVVGILRKEYRFARVAATECG